MIMLLNTARCYHVETCWLQTGSVWCLCQQVHWRRAKVKRTAVFAYQQLLRATYYISCIHHHDVLSVDIMFTSKEQSVNRWVMCEQVWLWAGEPSVSRCVWAGVWYVLFVIVLQQKMWSLIYLYFQNLILKLLVVFFTYNQKWWTMSIDN